VSENRVASPRWQRATLLAGSRRPGKAAKDTVSAQAAVSCLLPAAALLQRAAPVCSGGDELPNARMPPMLPACGSPTPTASQTGLSWASRPHDTLSLVFFRVRSIRFLSTAPWSPCSCIHKLPLRDGRPVGSGFFGSDINHALTLRPQCVGSALMRRWPCASPSMPGTFRWRQASCACLVAMAMATTPGNSVLTKEPS
jgi:hypothetical protein